jgi:hypothetical protein
MVEVRILMPADVKRKVAAIARRRHTSFDKVVLGSLKRELAKMPDSHLEERARRATKRGFDKFMAQVPSVPPDERDRLKSHARV